METRETTYCVEAEGAASAAMEALAHRFPVRRQRFPAARVTYLDTFDWALYRRREYLDATKTPEGTWLAWRQADGAIRHRLLVDTAPAFAADLPTGPFRAELSRVTGIRRLLPLVELEQKRQCLCVLDDLGKTVARAVLEQATVPRPGRRRGRNGTTFRTLRLVGVRGYDEAHESLTRFAADHLSLEPAGLDGIDRMLRAAGREPCDYEASPDFALHPEMRADDATKSILRALFEVVLANEPGVRAELDVEFLHDFRTAVRRTRSALTQIKGVLPARQVERFRREFKWLQQATNRKRDLDVYVLKVPAYKRRLPDPVQADLAPLMDFLLAHVGEEQERVVEALDSARYAKLVKAWKKFLDEPRPADEPSNAGRRIQDVASERIWKTYRRVLRNGRAIQEDTPAEALHDLRLDCKKLRYLVTFFRGLYDTKTIPGLIRTLKQLQDNLGDFNDLEVQQGALREFGGQMVTEGFAGAETLMAMGRLVQQLEVRQNDERRRFHQCFRIFAKRRNRRRYRKLFGPPAAGAPAP